MSELRPTRRSTKVDDRTTRLEGKDPVIGGGNSIPPEDRAEYQLMTEKELAVAAANVFEEDLVDPEQVRADIETAFPMDEGERMVRELEVNALREKLDRPGLVARLAAVINALPDVSPEGENAFFKYKFISDKQVLGLLRPRLSAAGIVIVPETVEEGTYLELTTAKGNVSRMTRMLVTFRVMDAYGGESFTGQSLGYGDDAGDKGANKAYTAAFKNFLIKLCMIGGERDIEDDGETDKRAADHAATNRPITISKGSGLEGIKQGGRQTQITKPQVNAIEAEAERLGITNAQLTNAIKAITGEEIAIDSLTFQQASDVLRALQAATPPEGDSDATEPADAAGDA